ncbi:MAG: hypothetical protein U0610_20980 [bacterium]
MYRRKLLSSFVTLSTPGYPGRGFLKARLEGLEHAILLAVLDSASPALCYRRSEAERRRLVMDWGRMWLLVDDVQDEHPDAASDDELLAIILGRHAPTSTHPLVRELARAAKAVQDAVSVTPWWDAYLVETKRCFDSQKVVVESRLASDRVALTLEAAEIKAGAFARGLVHVADPESISDGMNEALFWFGAWVQAVDDYADREKDAKSHVFTIFSTAADPDATLAELGRSYRERIARHAGRTDALIPLAEDLAWLAQLSRKPIVKPLFGLLNG